jgi:hypothetical protein
VRIIGSKNRLVYGVYRRHMKTIGCLGQIGRLFGAPATTRSWNTILSVLRILKSHEPGRQTLSLALRPQCRPNADGKNRSSALPCKFQEVLR